MRPIERGVWPIGDDRLPAQFQHYREARRHLLERIGAFCSYCELPLDHCPTVEHKEPKSRMPSLEKMWCNLLLACAYCQGCKGDTPIVLADYLWPDQDNTFRAFRYDGQLVTAHSMLPSSLFARAEKTRLLVGLDKVFGAPREPSDNDPRWRKREEVWGKATRARGNLRKRETDELRAQIEETAISSGCFSIWMTVFEDDTDMRRRFIHKFLGTSTECFDGACCPCARPGGVL